MDWYVANDMANVSKLRRELDTLLWNHSVAGADVDAALLVASELVTNAIENSDGPVWVSLDWGRIRPVLTVRDLGPGFALDELAEPDLDDVRGRGLIIASHLVGALAVRSGAAGGSSVTAELPVDRPPATSFDPPRSSLTPLPDQSERRDDGTFGRESFLRSLVVQLASTVEMVDGPARSEAMVAQVGTDVGSQIEAAFRETRGIDDALRVDEMATLFVELKAAIGGDFFVIEADDERIVLGNRTCPFGEAVQRAPSLCRMTSSVFGGIARRNRGIAAVDLEERIAVGDPQCRVTVWLRRPDDDRAPFVHVYGSDDEPAVVAVATPPRTGS